MAAAPVIGSAAWTAGEEYQDEYAARIHKFAGSINEEALLQYAASLHGGTRCTLAPRFSVGHWNLVRRIDFDDGSQWVARLRMPRLPNYGSLVDLSPEAEIDEANQQTLREMQSELATMKAVRQLTTIPVPVVYGYNLDENNAVGCRFSFMEYIHGTTAEQLSHSYPGSHQGIPEPFRERFWRQLARITSELASLRMPKIGSIVPDATNPGSFTIGPVVETQSGPYESTAAFYTDFPAALSRSLQRGGGSPEPGQEELVQAFLAVQATFPRTKDAGGFGLVNYDLNPNNVLVDAEFNVLAVIDWDSVVAVPDAALYRMPFLMGVSRAVPGAVATHPAMEPRQRLGHLFAAVVEQESRALAEPKAGRGETHRRFRFAASGFFSREALACQALVHMRMRQDWVNREWVQGLEWLRRQSDDELALFYSEN